MLAKQMKSPSIKVSIIRSKKELGTKAESKVDVLLNNLSIYSIY